MPSIKHFAPLHMVLDRELFSVMAIGPGSQMGARDIELARPKLMA